MSRPLGRLIVVSVVVAAIIIAFDKVNVLLVSVHGTVLDGATQAPVPGVHFSVQCSTNNLIHGTTPLRTIEGETSRGGTYQVPYRRLWDCDNAYISIEKPGYRRAWADLPATKIEIFTVADAVQNELNAELANSYSEYHDNPTPLQRYQRLYIHFLRSRRLAESQQNANWIADRYCERLRALYQELGEADRMVRERGFRGSHDAQVSSYCSRPVVEPKHLIPGEGWSEDPEDVKRWGGAA